MIVLQYKQAVVCVCVCACVCGYGFIRRDASICISRISYGMWLGGWLSVTAGIVSKRLNLS